MKRYFFHSLYIKWTFMFTGLILIAQGISLLFALRYILPDVQSNLSEKIYRKALFIQDMHRQGMPLSEDILDLTGDTDIHFYLFEMDAIPEEINRYRNIISLDMLQRATRGEIVTSYTTDGIKSPFCLLAVDNKIALLTPSLLSNDLTFFIGAYQRNIISSAMFASLLIVLALIVVIHPIKKVTQAARMVAGGNFNVQLHTHSVDEVGELIHNFNVMTKALQKNEYLKKEFVSNVSHEFKTPITSIEGFARLIKSKSADQDEITEYADIIIREAARLSNLSSNLLQLSVLDSDAIEPAKTPFLLDEQLREAILLLQNKWEEKNIEFDIVMDEISYVGHENLLLQVWINLLDNAVKFSPIGGVITVEARTENNAVIVSVTDQGLGVSLEQAARIFDRFYKADTSRSKEGSGLGLSIVKHILDLSKGSISVNQPGMKGTCFCVKLPL